MKTSALLASLATLLLAAAIPSLAGDSTKAAQAADAGECNRFKCMKACTRERRGTTDECRAACSLEGAAKPTPKFDPVCIENCMRGGRSRETCEKYCTYGEPTKPPDSTDLPTPPKPQS